MLITVLIFGLLYLTVRFTGIDIPNYTRNLVMLVSVDLAGFLFLMWKRPKEPVKEEEVVEVEVEVKEKEKEKEVAPVPIVDEKTATKNVKKIQEVEEDVEDNSEKIVIKKIEEVEEDKKS
jgi:hypothetical protein